MKKLNITTILKDKPRGTKLYSPVFGNVTLHSIYKENRVFPIQVQTANGNLVSHTSEGKLDIDGECMLFPSKEMCNWKKFAWKKGDVLSSNTSSYKNVVAMFGGWTNDSYTTFSAVYFERINDNKPQVYENNVYFTKDFHKDSNKAKDFIALLEKEYGGKFNPETLEIEKPKQEFKDGDIAYFKTKGGYKIIAIFQRFLTSKRPAIYADYFLGDDTVHIADKYDGYDILCDWEDITEIRLATEKEKELIFSKLASIGKKWNPDTKQIDNLPKPFDKVLVRDFETSKWQANIFSHLLNNDSHKFCCVFSCWRYCIPYEGNEHLIGTTKAN